MNVVRLGFDRVGRLLEVGAQRLDDGDKVIVFHAMPDGLPVWLNRQLAERAHAEGRSELGIIQEALTRYLAA